MLSAIRCSPNWICTSCLTLDTPLGSLALRNYWLRCSSQYTEYFSIKYGWLSTPRPQISLLAYDELNSTTEQSMDIWARECIRQITDAWSLYSSNDPDIAHAMRLRATKVVSWTVNSNDTCSQAVGNRSRIASVFSRSNYPIYLSSSSSCDPGDNLDPVPIFLRRAHAGVFFF